MQYNQETAIALIESGCIKDTRHIQSALSDPHIRDVLKRVPVALLRVRLPVDIQTNENDKKIVTAALCVSVVVA
jgi:hypothetical protein